jgi:hypothetical protein
MRFPPGFLHRLHAAVARVNLSKSHSTYHAILRRKLSVIPEQHFPQALAENQAVCWNSKSTSKKRVQPPSMFFQGPVRCVKPRMNAVSGGKRQLRPARAIYTFIASTKL